MTTPAASPGSGTPHLRAVPDPSRPAQIIAAPDWCAVLARPDAPYYTLAPLCGWALTETGAVVGLTVSASGRVGAVEGAAGFLGYLHASEVAREAVMRGWSEAGQALAAPAPTAAPTWTAPTAVTPEPAAPPAPSPHPPPTGKATARITPTAPVVGEWVDGGPLYDVAGVHAYVLDAAAAPLRYVAVDTCDTHPRARFYSRQMADGTFSRFAHRAGEHNCYLS